MAFLSYNLRRHPDSSVCSATTQSYHAAFAVSDDRPSVQHEIQGQAEANQPASATSLMIPRTRWQTTQPFSSVETTLVSPGTTGRSACMLLSITSATFPSATWLMSASWNKNNHNSDHRCIPDLLFYFSLYFQCVVLYDFTLKIILILP